MRTPLSLRIARLLLVGAAAGAFGVFAYIAMLARSVSVPLVLFLLTGIALAYAARSLGTDPRRGRLLAIAGGLTLAATGVLAGFGAGNLSLPMGALGILAAWAAVLHPPRRPALLAFGAYVAIGVLLTLPRGATLVAFPWLLSSVVLWPWTSTMFLPTAPIVLPIFATIGVALALAVSAFVAPRAPVTASGTLLGPGPVAASSTAADHERPRRTDLIRAGALALISGVLVTAAYVAWAYARPHTSAGFELDPIPLAVIFIGAGLLGLGLATLRALPGPSLASLAVGATVAVVVLLGRPTVECYGNGVSTTQGPWWLFHTAGSSSGGSSITGGTRITAGNASGSGSIRGTVTGSGSGGTSVSSGEIRRGDGIVIRYRCSGSEVVEFTIEGR